MSANSRSRHPDHIHHPRRIAIACQGGGSHAAFAAGLLSALLKRPDYADRFILSALTGTSGGALCAGVAWSWLLRPENTSLAMATPKARAAEKARAHEAARALHDLWMDIACEDLGTGPASGATPALPGPMAPYDGLDALGNAALVSAVRLAPGYEATCRVVSDIARRRMLELLRRHMPDLTGLPLDNPVLRVGATNILQGYSEPLAAEVLGSAQVHLALLASASIPPLFGPCPLAGKYYWDGLFSHNPPIDCLTNLQAMFPDEIWVIQINPTVCHQVPTTMRELIDRRNELSGNLALQAELYHIDAMNQLLDDEHLPVSVRRRLEVHGYHRITLRVVAFDEHLDFASKYERSRGHIQRLMALGRARAREFFTPCSCWTCPKEGVHMAAQVGTRRRPPEPSALCPNTACPSLAFCNAGPSIPAALDLAQHHLEWSHH